MEELIPWDRLADHSVLQAVSHETVESLRRRLVELGGHAQHNAPILIWLGNGQVAPTSVPALRTLAGQRGAPILRERLESLLPELCPEPWTMEGEAEALATARRRRLPVIATGEGVPVALALPPRRRLARMPAPGKELFDLFDQPLAPAATAGTRWVVVSPENTAAEVAAALGPGPDRDGTYVLLQAHDSLHVVDRRLEQEPDFASQVWPRTIAELCPRLEPSEARPCRELGVRQAGTIAERTFLVLLDEQGLAAGLMPPPPHLASRVLPGDADHDLFDLPLGPEGPDPTLVDLPGAPFVLAAPATQVARIATDLKTLPEEQARQAFVLVRAGDGSFAVVGARELDDALSGAGPEPWGQPLRQVVPRFHSAQACALETMGSRQARIRAQGREPVVLLRQGRPWRLLPGVLEPVVRNTATADLFAVPQATLDPYLYLRARQCTLEMLPREAQPDSAGCAGAAQEGSSPPTRAVNFWFATPESQPLAHECPLEQGRSYQLHVSLGNLCAESLTTTGSRPIREPAAIMAHEAAEGTPLGICLFSDDFDIPQPSRWLLLPPGGDSPGAAFDLKPRRASQAEDEPATVALTVYQRGNLVQAWQARVEVVRPGWAARSPEPQRGVLLVARDRHHLLPDDLGQRRLSLFVDRAPGGYHVDLVLSGQGQEGDGREGEVQLLRRVRLRREDVVGLVTKTSRQLTYIARSRPFRAAVDVDAQASKRALQVLALVGRQIYLALFEDSEPATGGRAAVGEMAGRIRQEVGEGEVIQIVDRARDLILPWGLVYDRPLWDSRGESIEVALDGFWGYRYEIELLTKELLQLPSGVGLEIGSGDRLQVAVGLDDRLAGARKQRELFAALAAESEGTTEYSLFDRGPEWLRLMSEGRHHLLYLFCHGFTERAATDLDLPDDLLGEFRAYAGSLPPDERAGLQDQEEMLFDVSDSWLRLTHDHVPLTMLRDCTPPRLEAAPLVLLNVCESAQVLPSLAGGFVPFFVERGARGVIGATCPMPSTFAHAFAREFFPRFLQGRPVGRVLWELRRAFLHAGNPLGLAYTLYGDADTRLALPV